MVREWRSCPHKFFNSFCRNLALQVENTHLIAGAAFATGLEVSRKLYYDRGVHHDDAVAYGVQALLKDYGTHEPHENNPKTPERMAGALEYYFNIWPLQHDNIRPVKLHSGHVIEFNFALPIKATHPQTGEPLLYGGRFDMIAEMEGSNFIEDDKTTTQLGASWSRQWELRSQFTGYKWGAAQYGIPTIGAIIRGVSILKNGYGNAQAIVYRDDWFVDRWMDQLLRDVERMKQQWHQGFFDRNLDEACSAYGGCAFMDLCKRDDASAEPWLQQYSHRNWNPVGKNPAILPETA